MNAFQQGWLALREPADRAARNARVLDACARHFAGHDALSVCDLGAGTGSSLRAIADRLPPRQHWTLVDRDAAHLAAARAALGRWTGGLERIGDGFPLTRDGCRIAIRTQICDLAQGCGPLPDAADLVTASALFDLVSHDWIGRFVTDLAAQGTPLYAALTFDGSIRIEPAHRLDDAVVGAFLVHQRGDKGFGPAAGAAAHASLAHALIAKGYAVEDGPSPWRLTAADAELVQSHLDGMASAVAETGLVSAEALSAWRDDRRMAATAVTVGHRDLFAWAR